MDSSYALVFNVWFIIRSVAVSFDQKEEARMASGSILVLSTQGLVHLHPSGPGGTFATHSLGPEDQAFDN